ncbi:SRPBCC domain-containing protein [Salibacterium salarium]|uniref:SRPBCC domain-containing protein n=1 Tax=Salibacterium salarium TaxID=284579 RepID=A0A3R9PGL3_9BACI|nr:SRPBCC domain-containing protein [Salibacterium salarium]RSL30255.1 SRPBCC domain-containing protein [Salibacterium salarium]
MSNQKTVSKVEGKDLILERVFEAPRDLVFQAFTQDEHLANWWGPEGWTTTNYQTDVRPDGVWHYCMRSEDGEESWNKAIYHEITEPEKLVYTDVFSDKEGNTLKNMPQVLVTLHFEELNGKTKLISRTQFPTEEQLKQVLDMGVIDGMISTWNCLEDYLENTQ